MNWTFLKQPPADKDTFPQIECFNHPSWTVEALEEIKKGNKFVLYDCSLEELRGLETLCNDRTYVVLVLPDPPPSARVRAYLTPERRKTPRSLPREADDDTDFLSPAPR